ncbi:unnamed protein product, partial [Prorocentrum cordatum]
ARDDALNCIFLPLIKKGHAATPQIKQLRAILANGRICKSGANQGVVDSREAALLRATVLDTLGDHSLETVARIRVDLAEFRKMQHGGFDKEWASFSREMDEIAFWCANKNQWRRAGQADMKEAPLMKERLEAADGIAEACAKASEHEREPLHGDLIETKMEPARLEDMFTKNCAPKEVADLFEETLSTVMERALRYNVAVKFATAEHCVEIFTAVGQIANHYFLTCKPASNEDVMGFDLVNFGANVELARELCDLADPAEENQRFHSLQGRLAFLSSIAEALDSCRAMSRIGSAVEQVTNDGGHCFSERLVKASIAAKARAAARSRQGVHENGFIPQKTFDASMRFAMQKVGDWIRKYQEADVEQDRIELQDAHASLAKLAFFFDDEEVGWKRGLSGDAGVDDALAQARRTVFLIKGLAAKTMTAIDDAEKCNNNLEDTAAKCTKDLLPIQQETVDKAIEGIRLANVPRFEAGAMQ